MKFCIIFFSFIFLVACTPNKIQLPTASATIIAPVIVTSLSQPTATQFQAASAATITPTPAPFAWLYTISLQYLAPTETEATLVANALGYLPEKAHPSNMCGPLAAAILRDGSIISYNTALSDFWLLNPRIQKNLLAQVFPENQFELTEIRTPIHQYNFREHPLSVGDFLYIYAGPNGNFDHMLTVTRIDESGRAYTVTNLNTDDGYIIDEFMLYDPQAPGKGLFYRWNNRDYDYLGLTGSGGFDIWRPQ